MRYLKVLLIYPSYAQYKFYDPFLPIGLGYIAQALADSGIEYEVINMSLGDNQFKIKDKIKEFKPDLIGISMMTLLYQRIYKFINYIKKIAPSIKIVVGGPHPTTIREKILKECQDIDYGVVLYGEEAIVELCREMPLKDIKGLMYRESGEVVFNGLGIPKIESISFPRYDKFELEKFWFAKGVPMPIISSRGCPYQCTFCISRLAFGDRFYARSARNVVDEIEYWHQRGRIVFDFLDDNFTFDNERVYAICDEIQKRGLNNLEFRCSNGVRADRVDRRLLERMREVGFDLLAFGVESGSDKILKVLKKGESLSQIETAVKDACELGYKVVLFFLVGSPCETKDDLNASFALALRYPVYEAKFWNIIPIPGTELFDWIEQNNFFIELPQHYLNYARQVDRNIVFVTPELPLKVRKEALRYGDSISKRIKKRYYQRYLRKYGIFGKLFNIVATSNFVYKKLMFIPVIKNVLRSAKRILMPQK